MFEMKTACNMSVYVSISTGVVLMETLRITKKKQKKHECAFTLQNQIML